MEITHSDWLKKKTGILVDQTAQAKLRIFHLTRMSFPSKYFLLCLGLLLFHFENLVSKELEFKVYSFRKKSRWGKAVNRVENKCKEDFCKLFRGLAEQSCIRKCISPVCYKEIYAWNELEEGERDIRWSSFKGCAADQLSKSEESMY